MSDTSGISGDKILTLVGESTRPEQGLAIDIIADVVCPWSRIGVQRLQSALQSVHGPATLRWFPFQLNPDIDSDGEALDAYLTKRFGDRQAVQPALIDLARMGADEGAAIRFDRISRVPNTFLAHCLLHQAGEFDLQTELAMTFFDAYFADGADLGDTGVLHDLALKVGLDGPTIDAALSDDRVHTIVRANEAMARNAGVAGVPNFLVNQRVFVVGAQETNQLVGAIDRALFGGTDDDDAPQQLH